MRPCVCLPFISAIAVHRSDPCQRRENINVNQSKFGNELGRHLDGPIFFQLLEDRRMLQPFKSLLLMSYKALFRVWSSFSDDQIDADCGGLRIFLPRHLLYGFSLRQTSSQQSRYSALLGQGSNSILRQTDFNGWDQIQNSIFYNMNYLKRPCCPT